MQVERLKLPKQSSLPGLAVRSLSKEEGKERMDFLQAKDLLKLLFGLFSFQSFTNAFSFPLERGGY